MSVRVKLNELNKKQKANITKCLYLQPKQTGHFNKGFGQTPKDPVLFYNLDKPNGEIVLPYTFGNSLLGRHVNSSKNYPFSKYDMLAEPRDYQNELLAESFKHLQEKGTTTLNLRPGWGKSFAAAYLASKLNGLVLVMFPSLIIKKGWISTFKQFTNAEVWVIDSKAEVPKSCNVILSMDTMFHKIPQNILDQVQTLVIDEAHMFCVPSRINCLLGVQPKYVMALTATLERRDDMHRIIHAVCGKHGVSAKFEDPFTVYKFQTGIKTEIEETKSGNPNWAKLVKDLAFDPKRNALIIDWIEHNPHFKIMVLTWNFEHAHFLKDILVSKGISSDVLAGKKTSYRDCRVLVGTVSKCGVGMDQESLCDDWAGERSNMLLIVGSTRSPSLIQQMCGRVFRAKFPIIVDFVDNNSICKNHWRIREQWYNDPDMSCTVLYLMLKDNKIVEGGKNSVEAEEFEQIEKRTDVIRQFLEGK